MATETDRTLFFDFMPMELGTIAGQKVRVQLYTVPGQVFYDATRKLVLRGADGVVFVADSQASMRESNIDSLENLKTNLRLNRIDPDKVAIVFQYNKRDLPNVATVEEMSSYLHPGNHPVVEASALQGLGVTQTLRAAVARILENLKNNVDTTIYEGAPLSPPDLTARSGVTPASAGAPKFSMRRDAPPPPPAPTPFVTPVEEAEEEEDPFGAVAVAVAEPEEEADDPFAVPVAEIHDAGAEREEIETLLANTRALIASLESALERARENEQLLMEHLSSS
jgi:mutual gliding-motility protein MglA